MVSPPLGKNVEINTTKFDGDSIRNLDSKEIRNFLLSCRPYLADPLLLQSGRQNVANFANTLKKTQTRVLIATVASAGGSLTKANA